jgi:7-keto-8-aminopelargonate synthetase-like enzyme
MVLVTSLGKAFGATGGGVVFHDQGTRDLVRTLVKTSLFSGPIQPASLCAAVESAKIHLSDEICPLQNMVKAKITYFEQKAASFNLPFVAHDGTPIFFLGIGDFDFAIKLVKGLVENCRTYVPVNGHGRVFHGKNPRCI